MTGNEAQAGDNAAGERFIAAGQLSVDVHDGSVKLNGAQVRLGGRAFSLLVALMRRPMRLVTKSELIDEVWDGLAVSDAVLTTAIRELRQALNDDARRPVWIKTEHGRGYRFIAPISPGPANRASAREEPDDAAQLSPAISVDQPGTTATAAEGRPTFSRKRHLAFVAAALLVAAFSAILISQANRPAPIDRSVAVLDFENLTPAADIDWFAAGLAEEITNALSRTPDLRVASRRASAAAAAAAAANQQGRPADIGQMLGVAHLLEGAIRVEDDAIRVTVSLVAAQDGVQVWSERYDRPLGNLLDLQAEISSQVARLLDTALDPEALDGMVAAGTGSIAAYEAYLRGQAAMRDFSGTGNPAHWYRAGDLMDRARSIDPDFADAHVASALIYRYQNTPSLVMRENPDTGERYRREYTARMDSAIRSARDPIEAAAYRARRDQELFNLSDAASAYEAYLAERPNDVDRWFDYSNTLVMLGQFDQAQEVVRRLDSLLPDVDAYHRAFLIQHATKARDFELAADLARRTLQQAPFEGFALIEAHPALLRVGALDEAQAVNVRIQSSDLGRFAKMFSEMRQICAEGDGVRVAEMGQMFIDEPRARIQAFYVLEMLGDEDAAYARLAAIDTPGLPGASREMLFYPSLDRRRLPHLAAALDAAGGSLTDPAPPMVLCPPPG